MNNYKYFHVSSTKSPLNLVPRVPSNYFTKNGYEDGKTKRICFSNSIDGCLAGLSRNLSGEKLYIHIPDNYKGSIKDNLYVQKRVPDSKITGEVWFLDNVKTKVVGELIVSEAKDEPQVFYYGDNKAELYFWKYKVKWYSIRESLIESSLFFKEVY